MKLASYAGAYPLSATKMSWGDCTCQVFTRQSNIRAQDQGPYRSVRHLKDSELTSLKKLPLLTFAPLNGYTGSSFT